MNNYNVNISILKKMLLEAYETGWAGCLELEKQSVDEIIEKYIKANELHIQSSITSPIIISTT